MRDSYIRNSLRGIEEVAGGEKKEKERQRQSNFKA